MTSSRRRSNLPCKNIQTIKNMIPTMAKARASGPPQVPPKTNASVADARTTRIGKTSIIVRGWRKSASLRLLSNAIVASTATHRAVTVRIWILDDIITSTSTLYILGLWEPLMISYLIDFCRVLLVDRVFDWYSFELFARTNIVTVFDFVYSA